MRNLKNYKSIAIVTILLFLISELFFYQEISKLISDVQKLSNIQTNYSILIAFFIVTLILGIFLFAISLKLLSLKVDKIVTKKINNSTKETNESDKEFEEETKKTEIETEENLKLKSIFDELNKVKDINAFTEKFLINIANKYEIVQGLFYLKDTKGEFVIHAKYAYFSEEDPKNFKIGEGLSGQVAKNKKAMNLSDIPENYIKIVSGSGEGTPKHLLILPVIQKDNTIGIIELASFIPFKNDFINQIIILFEKNSDFISKLIKN